MAERTAALTVAHRGVRENEERLRMAMDVAQMAAWEWDVDEGRMTWSTDPEALFGFPAGSFGPELRVTRAVHPEDEPRVDAALSSALAQGLYECEYRVVRPSGSVVWVTERGRVLRRSRRQLDKMVGVSRDVSAQRRAEQERERLLVREREARDEAERQSRIKDEFLATLEPRAANADERDSRLARASSRAARLCAIRGRRLRLSSATRRCRRS